MPHSSTRLEKCERLIRKEDSPLVRLNVLGNNIIVLNTMEAINDLLEKRSSNYSDRYVPTIVVSPHCAVSYAILLRNGSPDMVMLNELYDALICFLRRSAYKSVDAA